MLYFHYKRTESIVPGWLYSFKKLPLVRKTRHRARDAMLRSRSKISEKTNSLVDVMKKQPLSSTNNDPQSKDSSDDSFSENEDTMHVKNAESGSNSNKQASIQPSIDSMSFAIQNGALDDSERENTKHVTQLGQIESDRHDEDNNQGSLDKQADIKPRKVSFSPNAQHSYSELQERDQLSRALHESRRNTIAFNESRKNTIALNKSRRNTTSLDESRMKMMEQFKEASSNKSFIVPRDVDDVSSWFL